MSRAPRSLAGRTVAVTGAARGIGLAIARSLSDAGARVALGDLDAELAQAEAAALPGAVGLPVDVTDTASFEAFLDAAEADLGPLDVLVNNAGIMWVGRFEDESEATALRQFDVNFHGVARGLRLAVPRMRARGRGHVVTVASAGSRVAPAGEATYVASKHAVLGYCAAVREELRGSGVELSVVMPVVVETELAAGTSPGRGRTLAPQDVAAAVARVVARPRFEVWVPREVGWLVGLVGALPEPLRIRIQRATVPNQLAGADPERRAEYETRRFG